MLIKHFVLTNDGCIREYSSEEAFSVVNGMKSIPDLADLKVRYLQVRFDEQQEEDGLQVVTAGASIRFDGEGRLCEADNLAISKDTSDVAPISPFEQETCVQLALASSEITHKVQYQH